MLLRAAGGLVLACVEEQEAASAIGVLGLLGLAPLTQQCCMLITQTPSNRDPYMHLMRLADTTCHMPSRNLALAGSFLKIITVCHSSMYSRPAFMSVCSLWICEHTGP